MVAVHEFTHLALDEVNPDLPDWLVEGAAVYFGPRAGQALYDRACRSSSFEHMPTLAQLTRHYTDTPAADLFAYTLVASLAERYGAKRVNALLRTPADPHSALGASWPEVEAGWQAYVRQHCGRLRAG